jgi:hypothetical protein
MGINFLGLLVIIIRRDVVWAVAATWICVSVFTARPKPAPVYVRSVHFPYLRGHTLIFLPGTQITEILYTVLHPLALIASLLWTWFRKRNREGRIALRDEEGEGNEANGHGPREVDVDGVWG